MNGNSSTTHVQERQSYEYYLPSLILGVLWSIALIVAVVIHYYKLGSDDKWFTKYDNCDNRTVKHKYIVRVIIETPNKVQKVDTYSLNLLVKTEGQKVLANITLKGDELESFGMYDPIEPNKSVIHFFFYTKTSLEAMNIIVLNLMSAGWLKVFAVEIQAIDSTIANISVVGRDIKRLTTQKADQDQKFFILMTNFRAIEESAFPSRLLTIYEFILFGWFAINLMAFSTSTLIICANNKVVLCKDFNHKFLNSAYTGLAAGVLATLTTVVSMAIYRYCVKYCYEMNLNSILCKYYRCLYLMAVFGVGIGAGVMAGIKMTYHEHSVADERDIDVIVLWIAAIAVGFLIFIFCIPVVLLVFNCFGFFNIKNESKDNVNKGLDEKRVEPKKESIIRLHKKESMNVKELEAESDDYYRQLMKGGKKVKSISKYQGVPDPSPARTDGADHESVGESYFKQLAKNKTKVTSISKYGNKK